MTKSLLVMLLLSVLLAVPVSAPGQPNPRCEGCGQIIVDRYIEVNGLAYHPDHFVCDHCLKPIHDAYLISSGRNYHKLCYQQHVALVCSVCNRAIEDQMHKDYWGNVYHEKHLSERPLCHYCGRLIYGSFAAGRRSYSDGRELCGECAGLAVTTIAAAETLMVRAAHYLALEGVHVDMRGVTIMLLDRAGLKRLRPQETRHVDGLTDYASSTIPGSTRAEFSGGNLYMLTGMPDLHLMGVIAHELMHVWQGGRNALQDDDVLREGSASYAEYLVLQRIGTARAHYIMHQIMDSPEPDYGDGFRQVKRYAERYGTDALLRLLSTDHPIITVEE